MGGMSKVDEVYRSGGRAAGQARELKLTPGFVATAEGSVLIEVGHTRVLCNATIENGVPGWMRNSGRGWVTAEYGMLPRATLTRSPREAEKGKIGGRTHEIQRLIGRSCIEECLEVFVRPVAGMNADIIGNVVAIIAQGRRDEGQQPQESKRSTS